MVRRNIGLSWLFVLCSLFPSLVFASDVPSYVLVPQPASFHPKEGKPFVIDSRTKVDCPVHEKALLQNARMLVEYVHHLTGYTLSLSKSGKQQANVIRFRLNPELRKEGFRLNVTEQVVTIEAADGAGAFYAVQLLHKAWAGEEKTLSLSPVEIDDYPAMDYRGAMLDVSRHFFTVSQVKHFIDLMAFHRLNYFHWHLTDDQGWRIEIKKYPELTRTGAWRGTERYGGYYTQEEIKAVVAYAAERHITVIPEIDMPGHSQAALAAYPQLGCVGGPYEVATEPGGVHREVMCIGSNFTLPFVKEVLKEVAELFPAPYIHIGGDEVPRDRWQKCTACQSAIQQFGLKATEGHSAEDLLQGAFNMEMANYLKTLGKRMIGWDEVLSDNISPETIIMSWRGLGKGVNAVHKGHDVILSSTGHLYLNNYQTVNSEQEPMATGGLVEMKTVYETPFFSPQLTGAEKQRILGAEACLWTSHVPDTKTMEYMLLPRLAAFAEAAWCEDRRGSYNQFLRRLPSLLDSYRRMGYTYAPHFFTVSADYSSSVACKYLEVQLQSVAGAQIYYTRNGEEPSSTSERYQSPLQVDKSCQLRAVAYLPNGLKSDEWRKEVVVNKATFADIHLLTPPAERYEGENGKVLVDGIRSPKFHTSGLWVGYYSDNLVAVIDLKTPQSVREVKVSALTDLSSWIMGPASITVSVSGEDGEYRTVAHSTYPAPVSTMSGKESCLLSLPFEAVSARYVKVTVERFKELPEGHAGQGEPPYLFVDEIGVY